MKVNRTNYESFLIDLLEGNLNNKQQEEMFAFLKRNPDLNEEYELLRSGEVSKLSAVSEENMDFTFLKKEENIPIRQEELVALLEGDLTPEEERILKEKLQLYPSYERDLSLFQLSKLPNEPMVYVGKDKLKKKIAVLIPLYIRVSAIAAIFVAIAFTSLLYVGSNQREESPLANLIPLEGNPESAKPHTNTADKGKVIKHKESLHFQNKQDVEPPSLMATNESILKEIGPRELHITTAVANLRAETPKPVTARIETIGSAFPVQNTEVAFLKPGEWLLQKFKYQLPEKAQSITDSLVEDMQESPAELAMQLVQKTTGITYQEKKDEAGDSKGFSIVSRYFAYERIVHY